MSSPSSVPSSSRLLSSAGPSQFIGAEVEDKKAADSITRFDRGPFPKGYSRAPAVGVKHGDVGAISNTLIPSADYGGGHETNVCGMG